MKKTIIIPLLALVIASCGGGNNQTQGGGNATDTASTATTTEQPAAPADEQPESQGLAYDILKQIMQSDNSPICAEKIQDIEWNGNKDSEHTSFKDSEGEYEMHCLPHKDGGYVVLLQDAPYGDACPPNYYTTWRYNNGTITKTNTLPRPTIDDFYYDLYTKYPDDAVAVLKDKIANCLQYEYQHGDKVKVTFYTADNFGNTPKELEKTGRTMVDNGFPSIIYNWDGTQFVQKDIDKSKANGHIIFDVQKAIAEQCPHIIDKITFREIANNCDDPSDETIKFLDRKTVEGLACLPIKTGGYYIIYIDNLYSEDSKDYTLFYKDGKMTEIPKSQLYPQPTIDDFYTNANQIPKEIHDLLANEIENNLIYLYHENNDLLNVWLGDPKSESLNQLKNDGFPFPMRLYIWDGERFVPDPDDKPQTIDMKYFNN